MLYLFKELLSFYRWPLLTQSRYFQYFSITCNALGFIYMVSRAERNRNQKLFKQLQCTTPPSAPPADLPRHHERSPSLSLAR